ncbi:ADP-ribose diphosphatase [Alteripontixanthobacter maritimus]|uniref:GDP-mannose pyrophosphatase n=1 Tax=Alteripontixanthobacter maritimus TaxID=2161824 RepID=A0A369Q450_9SPHN|nr:NUDIX hydrolase [Alteripontixanthobacter maritimus]RDC59514.1 ADP-ribose diphosphatase [Alteripontixanthobacter maritimus]
MPFGKGDGIAHGQVDGLRDPDADLPEEIRWQGKFITAKTRGRWEYVGRARGIRAAVILAVEDGHILLVEQYRVPLGKPCIELPAGLIGDEDGGEGEVALAAAGRELEEETGYRAARLTNCGEFYSSPGMVSEAFTLVRAQGLTKVGDGGGVAGENIAVHRVPLDGIEDFITDARVRGAGIDTRILLALGQTILGDGL